MKILAFSDLHRSKRAALAILNASEQADIVVGAGDFATKGRGLTDTIDILRHVTVPMVVVPGNHEQFDDLRDAFAGLPNGHVLHGSMATTGGVCFFGMGYEVHDEPGEPWNQRVTERDAKALLDRSPDNAILVTHNPPYCVADLQSDGTHEGSHSIRESIELKAPRLHLCGHIHYSWGTSGVVAQTAVHNLGPSVNWFHVE